MDPGIALSYKEYGSIHCSEIVCARDPRSESKKKRKSRTNQNFTKENSMQMPEMVYACATPLLQLIIIFTNQQDHIVFCFLLVAHHSAPFHKFTVCLRMENPFILTMEFQHILVVRLHECARAYGTQRERASV